MLVAALAGAAVALLFAFLVITLRANQIVSGLALTIFAGAAGLSSYLGNDLGLADAPAKHQFVPVDPFGLADVPIIGPIVFGQTWLVYASWAGRRSIALYLARTRPGLNVRAVGESPQTADAMGISVTAYRYAHVLAGGALAGVGGACFSLALTPQWVDGSPAAPAGSRSPSSSSPSGAPELCLVGAYFFGAFQALPFTLQARGVTVAPELFQALPYVMTIVVLVIVSSGIAKRRLGAPGALGVPFVREER